MADPKSGAQGPKPSAATATGAQAAQGAAGPGAGPQTVVLQIAPPTPSIPRRNSTRSRVPPSPSLPAPTTCSP
jgi:hypothetical protein